MEDPRLKMRGRFFFDPHSTGLAKIDNSNKEEQEVNSVLLRKGKTEIIWDEEEKPAQNGLLGLRKRMTHQKICQTDETQMDFKSTQTAVETQDIGVQINLMEAFPPKQPLLASPPMIKDDNSGRSLMDARFELGGMRRETYDHQHGSKIQDSDLRWSLNAQKRPAPNPWMNNKPIPPGPKNPLLDTGHHSNISVSLDHSSRNVVINSSSIMPDEFCQNQNLDEEDEYELIHNKFATNDNFSRHAPHDNNYKKPIRPQDEEEDSDDLAIIEEHVFNPRDINNHPWARGNNSANSLNTKTFKLPQRTITTLNQGGSRGGGGGGRSFRGGGRRFP